MDSKSKKLGASVTLAGIISSMLLMWIPTAYAAKTYTCDMLNDPQQTKDVIVSIAEEQFGGKPGDTENIGGATILQCVRETKCEQKTPEQPEGSTQQAEPKTVCTPTYKSTCTPNIAGGVSCARVQVYIAESGTALLFGYVGTIYRWAAGVIGVITVLYLIIGGIEIATAGDNTGKIDEAKQKILQSIAGLVILFLSAIILYTINPNFFTL